MLRTGPWNRLPLTIRWLKQEYKIDFDPTLQPPPHMPYAFGPVKSVKVKDSKKPKKSKSGKSVSASEDVTDVNTEADDVFAPLTQNFSPKCACCKKKYEVSEISIMVNFCNHLT